MFCNIFAVSIIYLVSFSPCRGDYSFLAVGDWGGKDDYPYYTAGQYTSANGMDKVARSLNSKFVLALGDNFYHSGVDDAEDKRFQQTFEDVYTQDSLQNNWYVCPGNHDYKGNVSAQVLYSQESDRWVFPSLYHKQSFTSEDGITVDILMIDTVDLADSVNAYLRSHEDAHYFDPLPLKPRSQASDQWDWIETQLKESTAEYLLVGGHYPVYSVCSHGPTSSLIEYLLPMLEQYNAHYFAGHDHCMEHIKDKDSSVHHFLSGMGIECCYDADKKDEIPEDSLQWYIADDNADKGVIGGFSSVTLSSDKGMIVSFYDQDGNTLYTAPTVPPRSKSTSKQAIP